MTKDLLQLQIFIEVSDIIHDTDGSITFVLHDLFKLKKDGSPRSKVKLFAFLEKVAKKAVEDEAAKLSAKVDKKTKEEEEKDAEKEEGED